MVRTSAAAAAVLIAAATTNTVSVVDGVQAPRGRQGQGKSMNAFQRAAAGMAMAAGMASGATPHPKFQDTQSELSYLIEHPDAMQARFQTFVSSKAASSSSNGIPVEMPLGETLQRYDAFKDNVQKAYERNLKGNGQVVHGITSLMDLTPEQFRQKLGYIPHSDTGVKHPATRNQDGSIGTHWAEGLPAADPNGDKDWRDEGAVTDVKNQEQCGSCWAFSATESVESAALVQGLADQFAPFVGSPQELVSCDNVDSGCHGGLPEYAFAFLQKKPMETESDYPYEGYGDTCMFDSSEGKFKVDEIHQVTENGEGETTELTQYIQNKGPTSIGVAANDDWQTYVGGVMDVDTCPADRPDHAVQAVGVVLSAETPYWIIRNSWGADWGEDGFIRITYGDNTCNIASDATAVTVEKYDSGKRSTKFLQV